METGTETILKETTPMHSPTIEPSGWIPTVTSMGTIQMETILMRSSMTILSREIATEMVTEITEMGSTLMPSPTIELNG